MRISRGCFKWVLLPLLVVALALYIIAENYLNLSSNAVAFAVRNSDKPLQIRLKRGEWKTLSAASVADLDAALMERYSEEGFRWSMFVVRRPDSGILAGAAQTLFGAEVHVIWIWPEKFDFFTTFEPGFKVTTARARLKSENLWLALTANFRDPSGKPLGWVVHDGHQVNPPFPQWTGVFFVKNGMPYFGPKSLVDEVPGTIEEGTQGYPSVMKNHTVFPYVDLAPNKFYDGKKITYRSLAGTRRDGSVLFILSGDGGVMNVSEVTEMARKLEVQHATLLDGGRALQYSIRAGDHTWDFHAFNTELPLKHRWLERQQSPVYIGVRRKAPEIVAPQ